MGNTGPESLVWYGDVALFIAHLANSSCCLLMLDSGSLLILTYGSKIVSILIITTMTGCLSSEIINVGGFSRPCVC